MSKISLTPNASGTGTFTIASPNSNTDRTLTLPDAAGEVVTTGSTGAVSQTMLATAVVPLGAGQAWTDVTASRALSTVYTNTTGRPIMVSVYFSGANSSREAVLHVAGSEIDADQAASGRDRISVSGIVPAGAIYEVFMRFGSTQTLNYWRELR